jgi:hypothetical protein
MASHPGKGWRRIPFVALVDDIRRYLHMRRM